MTFGDSLMASFILYRVFFLTSAPGFSRGASISSPLESVTKTILSLRFWFRSLNEFFSAGPALAGGSVIKVVVEDDAEEEGAREEEGAVEEDGKGEEGIKEGAAADNGAAVGGIGIKEEEAEEEEEEEAEEDSVEECGGG